MSSIVNNYSALLSAWWGPGCEYNWFVTPTNAANIVFGANPPYQISDFGTFFPQFTQWTQGIAALAPSAGLLTVAINPASPGLGYQVGDQVSLVQQGASSGVVQVTSVDVLGEILAFTILTAGTGYSVANGLPSTGGSGQGAIFNVTAVDVLGGAGYVVGDVVNIVSQGGANGTATVAAVDTNGSVTQLTITNAGTGYNVLAGLLTTGGSGAGLQVSVTQLVPYVGIVPQPVLSTFVALASAGLSYARWIDQWNYAMSLFIAHYCTLWLQSSGDPGSTAGQIAQAGLQTGVTISKSAGDVSISKEQIAARHLEQFGQWLLTQPGQILAGMASAQGAGCMYVY
jgi:hypothetical protein